MEDLVSLMASGFAQELFVALLHHRVQMALAQRHILILVIQSLSTQLLDIIEAVVSGARNR